MTRTLYAFTLIELLVVVTMIVLLLALLVPAMDRAIYQAEMARCASNIKAMNGSVIVYAFEFRRHYPYRPRARNGAASPRPEEIRTVPPAPGLNYDDRITLRGYVSPNKMMNCPLARKVNLETEHPETQVFSNFQFWWGWQYTVGGNYTTTPDEMRAGMFKVGDAVEWKDSASTTYRFHLLSGDMDFDNNSAQGYVQSAHPDSLGLLANRPQEDNPNTPWGNYTNSFWTGNTTGTVDRQFGKDDGSVERVIGIKHEIGPPGSRITAADGRRLVKVILRANTTTGWGEYTYLPTP